MYDEREHTAPLRLPKMTGGDWYLRGFADAYHRKPAVIPGGRWQRNTRMAMLKG